MTKRGSRIAQGRGDAILLANLIGESINVHTNGHISIDGSPLANELFSAGWLIVETIRPEASNGGLNHVEQSS